MHVFLLCKYARVDPFMPYTWEGLFFMKKYMVWLISALMAVSMTACSNAQKKDTKDQAQITTAAKENATQTEAAKITSKKEKNEKKKDKKKLQKSKKNSKKTKSSTAKKKETSTTTAKKKKVKKKKTKEKRNEYEDQKNCIDRTWSHGCIFCTKII